MQSTPVAGAIEARSRVWSDPRLVFSTWRELRTYLDVRFNDEMRTWFHENVARGTRISPYPKADDPQGKVDVRNGTAHGTMHFPFTHAEWESTLLEVYMVEDDH